MTTFGEIRLSTPNVIDRSRFWGVRCEPHVRARLKRVFPRAPQGPAEWLPLLDTPENSRELLWFLQRYPMLIAAGVQAYLESRAAEHVESERAMADLLEGRATLQAFELAKPPRDYQVYAANMVPIRGGLLLGDDVGLGKTVTGICPMAVPQNLPAVVVCPAHLPDHWREKLAEFAPQLRVHTLRREKYYPLTRQKGQRLPDLWDELPDVILTSYHKLRGWADTLAKLARYVVLDEVQQLRHEGSLIYNAAQYLCHHVPLRMGLSATPIYNYGVEFWAVIDALLPGVLGDREEFIREWCVAAPGGKARLREAEQFGAYLRREGILLRRTRKDVGRELPKVQKILHTVEYDGEALQAIEGQAINLAKIILSSADRFKGERMQAASRFDTLVRQATGVAKAPYVAEFVKLLLESGEKVLLFGWHHEVYNIWADMLRDYNPVRYTGEQSATEKREAKEMFLDGRSQLMMMSLRAGAGVDGLQEVCSIAVFGELDWSPGVHEQCVGRIDRDGQQTPVLAYFLAAETGCDPRIVDVLGVKREQIEGVRNPGQGLLERIDTGENSLRAVAKAYLAARGEPIPEETPGAHVRAPEPDLEPETP